MRADPRPTVTHSQPDEACRGSASTKWAPKPAALEVAPQGVKLDGI
jgi:hypothetical protein